MENILNLDKVLVKTERFVKVKVDVMIVQSCNFNDTFYIAEKEILVSELKDSPITYFDPFLGKAKNSDIKVAIACIDEDEYYVIVEENGVRKVVDKENYLDVVNTCKYEERTFLASHISLSTK